MNQRVLASLFLISVFQGINGCEKSMEDSSGFFVIDSHESDAVVWILGKKQANQPILEEDWKQLFSSDGYMLLKKRAGGIRRDFTDDEFKGFVLSDSLFDRFQSITTSLEKLKKIDVKGAVSRALAYLPKGTSVRIKWIYLLIKPTINSFVFMDTFTNPAIFLNVDPGASTEKFENKLVHELFHIGYAHSFGAIAKQIFPDSTLFESRFPVFEMIARLSEGLAMLAAAGGPDIHPHAVSKADARARWDNDMRNFNSDFKRIDHFLIDVLDNKLTSDEVDQTDSSFAGYQGPWYTVGWKMAATIEKTYGRARLIHCISDPRILLSTYNEAASISNRSHTDSLALWSPSLIEWIAK